MISTLNSECQRVCESMSNVDRTRTHAAVSPSSCSSSRAAARGALSLIPFCLGISGHSSESRQGQPTVHWGPISGKAVGGPNAVQHSSAVQKHGKHGSGALATRALVTRVCCVMADPETKEVNEMIHENFQEKECYEEPSP